MLWALLSTAVSVLAVSCGNAGTVAGPASPLTGTVAATHQRPAVAVSPGCAPGQIGPLDASFTSPKDGWLLGITLKNCWEYSGSRIVVRKTTDGGLHWTPAAAPPVAPGGIEDSPQKGVLSIVFADARDGWAFGPDLWGTHDGGASWHRVDTAGRKVYSLAATGGQVVAAFLACGIDCSADAAPPFTIETAPAGTDAWQPVPGGTGAGTPMMVAKDGLAFAVGARAGAGGDFPPGALLAGPADGSARWQRHAIPCTTQGTVTAAAVTASRLVMACAVLGAHPAPTTVYQSADDGAQWSAFARLGLYDGAAVVSQLPANVLLVAGIYDGVRLSRDGGRTWARPGAIDENVVVGGGAPVSAALTSESTGYALVWQGPFWVTRDGGRSWATITVR